MVTVATWPRAVTLVGEAALATFVLWAATQLRYGDAWSTDVWASHLTAFLPAFLLLALSGYVVSLYDYSIRRSSAETFTAALRAALIALVGSALYFYFSPASLTGLEPRRILLGFFGAMLPLVWAWHLAVAKLASRIVPPRRLLIIGRGARASRLADEVTRRAYLGFTVVAQTEGDVAELERLLNSGQVDIVVNSLEQQPDPDVLAVLQRCLAEQRPVVNLAAFTEQILRKVPVEHVDQLWFIENFSLQRRPIYEAGKRALDVAVAVLGLAISLPLLPIIIVAVGTTPGPIIFKQVRTGYRGRPFKAMKFRSMVQDAEANGPQWASRNDPRITATGRFLRRSRLDEIPQLLNVLRGEMSIVGPRPERPEFIGQLAEQIPFYRERLLVKPGLTGWAQIHYPYGDSVEDALEKLRFDLYYVKNRSFLLDLSTILKTINTVLRGGGR